MPTDVLKRSAPPRRFENYTMTRLVDASAGLTAIPDSMFTQVPGGPGDGATDDAVSNRLPLGFDFSIDNITYNQWAACTNGWMVLADPTLTTFFSTEILSGSSWENERIRATFTSKAVLLAPWFDDLRNVTSQPSQLAVSPFSYSSTKVNRIQFGLETPPSIYNPSSYGVSYFNDVRSTKGRRLIVRWSSISNFTAPSSVIKFETVIYENGLIEYRYTPKSAIALAAASAGQQFEAASIGLFMPNGTNRFRDFSVGLGYRDDARQEYIYGAYAYTPGYTDTPPPGAEGSGSIAPYTVSLTPFRNWPGLSTSGCIISFAPPVRRRRVLPRAFNTAKDSRITLPLVARTGDSRLGSRPTVFDDRKSPNYSGGAAVVVNYPSTLSRFFGGSSLGTTQRQDVFSGDFLVTGSVVKSAIDQYVNEQPQTHITAFAEQSRHEQDASTPFYTTGSNPSYVASGFDQRLRSKTQIRFTLPVNHNTVMPTSASSIYYYNSRAKAWEVPVNASYVIADAGIRPPVGTTKGDQADPNVDARRGRIIEDARGFGPIGNVVSSGSRQPTAVGEQTDVVIGSAYNPNALASVVGKRYHKSIRNNDDYKPSDDETFRLPINGPFLIEKAVFEIPLAAGAGWFADQTQCFQPLSGATAFDFAGPALTFALHRQVLTNKADISAADFSVIPVRRDMILTGTVTHALDNVSNVVMSQFPPYDATYQIRPVGFLAYAGPAGGVVAPNASNQFTGSVTVEATALSATGVVLKVSQQFTSGTAASNATNARAFLQKVPTLSLTNTVSQSVTIASVSPLGRGGSGFQQAGRCVLGNEYVTVQGLSDQSGLTAHNPLYLGSALTTQMSAAMAAPGFSARAIAAVSLTSHYPSPYLVMPNDRIVLSVSKMRPFIYSAVSSSQVPTLSGSLQHDIRLIPGNINVTLYGSELREGVEAHDTLNQSLGSDAVHEIIGAEPVRDQFEVAYRNEYTGSFVDNVMLGQLLTQTTTNGQTTLQQGVRDRKLSRLNARLAPQLGTRQAELVISPSKAYRTQPWFEQVGNVRHVQHVDSSERFWDSMMPGVSDCFAADGSGIFIASYGALGNPRQVDVGVSSSLGLDINPRRTRLGWIWFDYQHPALIAAGYGPLINANWTKSFPFEPRYRNASRQVNVSKSFLATYFYNPSSLPVISPIEPRAVNGFVFGPVSLGTGVYSYDYSYAFPGSFPPGTINTVYFGNAILNNWVSDANLNAVNQFGYYTTGSAGIEDASRALFGFGDRNTYFQYNTTTLLGAGHFAETRDIEGPHPDGQTIFADTNNFGFSPKIRGWKYGVYSGLPSYSKAYWRPGRFGQARDMLEQRPYTKFFRTEGSDQTSTAFQPGEQPAAVTVNFIDSTGRLTAAENTWSNNLSFECTSSLPFFDGMSLNRPTVVPQNLNLHPNVVRQDSRGNIHIA